MAYIGQLPSVVENNSFLPLDDISTYTLTFDGSSASVVSTSDNTITSFGNRFVQGQRVVYSNGGGSNIGGLTNSTAFFIIRVDKNTFKLATNANNAAAGTAINLSGLGSGSSHTLTASFDGVNKKFKATHTGGKIARITRSSQLMVSINNVIQKPIEDTTSPSTGFSVDHLSTIHFASAPSVGQSFFGTIFAANVLAFDVADNRVDEFVGDGSTTVFTLSRSVPSLENVLITLNGVVQHPDGPTVSRSYKLINSGIQVEFASAPEVGLEISIRHIGFSGAATGDTVTGFYGRTGNVQLVSTDNIVANNATLSGHLTFDGGSNSAIVNSIMTDNVDRDTVSSNIVPVKSGGIIAITSFNASQPRPEGTGLFYYDSGTTPQALSMATTSSSLLEFVFNADYSGNISDYTDNKVTIIVRNNSIRIVNREDSQSTLKFQLTFL